MSGTVEGGQKTVETNRKRHGEDYYHKLGKMGGSVSHRESRPFVAQEGLAKRAGKLGGRPKGFKVSEETRQKMREAQRIRHERDIFMILDDPDQPIITQKELKPWWKGWFK